MLERKLVDLGLEGLTTDCDQDGERPTSRVRALLSAAAELSATLCERGGAVVDDEIERLALLDPAAAQQALVALRIVRDRLVRATSDVRMAGVLSEALVRAADALPDQFGADHG